MDRAHIFKSWFAAARWPARPQLVRPGAAFRRPLIRALAVVYLSSLSQSSCSGDLPLTGPSGPLVTIGGLPAVSTLRMVGPPVTLTARGQTAQIRAALTLPAGATQEVTDTVQWNSSNGDIAVVGESGVATAVRNGRTTITATLGHLSVAALLTVAVPAPQVVIDTPGNDVVGPMATFRWRIENRQPGEIYRSDLRFDKGTNACNGFIEEAFDAQGDSCLAVAFTPRRYSGALLDFAIRVDDESGNRVCVHGGPIRVDMTLPPVTESRCRTVQAAP